MATAAELAALDGAHQSLQAANSLRTLRALATYWALVQSGDLAGSGTVFLERAIPMILAGWRTSAQLGLAHVQTVRRVQLPDGPAYTPPPILESGRRSVIATPGLIPPATEQLRTSLIETGIKRAAVDLAKTPRDVVPEPRAGESADLQRAVQEATQAAEATNRGLATRRGRVMENAGANMLAAAMRHVQNGGRAAVVESVRADPVARGYIRVTREGTCYFCAALASRGPVYQEDSFAESDPRFTGFGDQKVHDDCKCTLRPVYKRGRGEWTDAAVQFEDLWKASTKGKSGTKKMLAFRQAYEGRAAS